MKRILILSILFIALASCQKHDIVYDPIQTMGEEKLRPGSIRSKQLQRINFKVKALNRRWSGQSSIFNQQLEEREEELEMRADALENYINNLEHRLREEHE